MKKLSYKTPVVHFILSKWDIFFLSLIFFIFSLFTWSCSSLGGTIEYSNLNSVMKHQDISMDLWNLPRYAVDTTIRMFIALFFSFLFSLTIGALVSKSKRAESLIIPVIDIFQSIPILGFLSIAITGFLALLPHSLWGAQLAVIFGLFTTQVWNMILSFYQSLKTIPKELSQATEIYQLSGWQRFWKLEVPFSMPGLVWNAMMSISASWFMIVASESIVVNFSSRTSAKINLPGIGNFINQANNDKNFIAITAAILTMLMVIILCDQLLFRPLVKWSEKFFITDVQQETLVSSWFLTLLQRSKIFKKIGDFITLQTNRFVNLPSLKKDLIKKYEHIGRKENKLNNQSLQLMFWYGFICFIIFLLSCLFCYLIHINNEGRPTITLFEVVQVFGYGLLTLARVLILILCVSVIWVPIGIWIGLRPQVAEKVQPYAQIFAAFPVNVLYGLFGTLTIKLNLNFNIYCILLMALGSQWYILFNVIAGASVIPYELKMAVKNIQLKGLVKWTKFLFPAVMPFYITGAITAAGGAWNASIICEYINWGENSVIMASGIGSYISQQYHSVGDRTAHIVLGVFVMCSLVFITNRLIWKRLYDYSERRFSMNM